MTTANDVITRAFQLNGVKPSEAPIEASEISDGLDALNDLLAEWPVDIGYEGVSSSSDEIIVDDYVYDIAIAAMKPNLAVRLATEYGAPVSISLTDHAKSTYSTLLKCVVNISAAEFGDNVPVGSGNYSARANKYFK